MLSVDRDHNSASDADVMVVSLHGWIGDEFCALSAVGSNRL